MLDVALRVAPRQLGDMLKAFLAAPGTDLHDCRQMSERLGGMQPLPAAAQRQLREMASFMVRSFSRQLCTDRRNMVDLAVLARLSGQPGRDLLGEALRELGSQPAELTADECLRLTARIAPRLGSANAGTVLDDITATLARVAPSDSGDGPFEYVASAPGTLPSAVAGYIWSALGSVAASTRWRAAHCVRLLIAFGCEAEIDTLHRLALGDLSSGGFTDSRLPFYDKHALQWLLFAVTQACQNPRSRQNAIAFLPLLKRVTFHDAPHAVMQHLARSALEAMDAAGLVPLSPEERDACKRLGSPVRTIVASRWTRTEAEVDEVDQETASARLFFFDFKDYWCRYLGQAFGMSAQQILSRASQAVPRLCQWPYAGELADDPRYAAGVFGDGGRKTWAHKTDVPEAEDLGLYLAQHALWTVAGDLVKGTPVHRESSSEEDLFTEWLQEFLPTRKDGRWLADRRDSSPPSSLGERDSAVNPNWVWTLSRDVFTARMLADEGWVTVREYSSDANGQASQDVWIHSALATPDKARALALAVQTAPSYMAFRIPDADDREYQYHEAGFELTGWISDGDAHHSGADTSDPFAASVRYPPPRPDEGTIRLLGLVPDADMRTWRRGDHVAVRSRVWDDETSALGSTAGGRGQRLQICRHCLHEMLDAADRALILTVMIDRDDAGSRRRSSRSDDDDALSGPRERSYKVYLFDAAGGCRDL